MSYSNRAAAKQRERPSATSGFRLVSIILFFGGIAIMSIFAVLAPTPGTLSRSPAVSVTNYEHDVKFFVPAIVGGLLAFAGGVRISLFLRPRNLFLWGCVLLAVSASGSLATTVLPSLQSVSWTRTYLLPFFIFRILAIIFSTTALFRWKAARTDQG